MSIAILQARSSSRRLPRKVLEPILGVPLILRALERIARASLIDQLVLATSVDSSDDELARVVADAGYAVHRGPLDDVLSRFLGVLADRDVETVVRLTGDNALSDPVVIDQVIEAHLAAGSDYTANTLERSFPRGLDVEVTRPSALRALNDLPLTAEEREHVTMGIYRRPKTFALHSVTQQPDRSDLRWTVDYPEDLEFARAVYGHFLPDNPLFGQADILELLERHPELVHREPRSY